MGRPLRVTCCAALLAGLGACGGGEDGADDPGGEAPSGYAARPANLTCVAPPRPTEGLRVTTEPAFPALRFRQPLELVGAPGDDPRLFVVEKEGAVKVFEGIAEATSAETFIDLSHKVSAEGNEAGLLGMAIHPDFAQNRQVFLSYTTEEGPTGFRSVVSRFRASEDGRSLDPSTEEVLLSEDRYAIRHNGGSLAFGPDGYLYVSFGDGGGAALDDNPAQDPNRLQGKLLRLDVATDTGYAIPPDNPFAQGGGRPEVYALGFRNPWRFSFDRATGELWAGDVGEEEWEEVDLVVAGGNYGWPLKEGSHCFAPDGCDTPGLIDPVVEYPHSEGVAITGGYVYRGDAIPALAGRYFFADYTTGKLWTIAGDPAGGQATPELLMTSDMTFAAFHELPDGEILGVDIWKGTLHRLVAAEEPVAPGGFPATLSETGCFEAADVTRPREGLIPYGVNAQLWSDGADKERFLALPDGETIRVAPDGDWDFPEGTVLVKTFLLGGRRVETRLFMRHPDGVWAGYSYEWNDAQTDAALLAGGVTKEVGGQTWTFPSRSECMRCHTDAAGRALGPETSQLNRLLTYPSGTTANQLTTLEAIGMFDAALGAAPEALPRLPEPGGEDPLAGRARAYLHSNCSNCHRPGGPGGGPADLRFEVPLAEMGVCDVPPERGSLGIADARVVAPGQPERSVLLERMRAPGPGRMPPLASHVVDGEGVALVEAWIRSLDGCR